jgi:hypothetical protein
MAILFIPIWAFIDLKIISGLFQVIESSKERNGSRSKP